jgi:N-carbamoylputrescine amidase
MARPHLAIALVHDVFHDAGGPERLLARLGRARAAGAELAVLPELPLNAWCPATREPRDEDAEGPDGPRQRALASAARAAGIALLGGVIFRDGASGRRFSRALLFDREGRQAHAYDKLHLPSEEGYWEADHYSPGELPPRRIDGFAMPLGIQLCSDLNRPEGCHLLGAQGVEAILAPRATPPGSYDRWRLVIRANAITSCAYVVSANRPAPEGAAAIGGPSLAVTPDGRVLAESTEPVQVVGLDRDGVELARREYPGYLAVRAELYARGWAARA